MLIHQELTGRIIGAAIEVHKALGPGLLESAYHRCMMFELTSLGLEWRSEVEVPIRYKGHLLDHGYRVDLLVERSVIVEVKAVEQVAAVHEAQLLTYMKLLNFRVGLLINFNVPVLTEGILRRVL